MQIFAEVSYLCKYFWIAITPGQDFWDTIAIVIILDTLNNNFDTISTSLLKSGNNQIQSILQSKKAKNISKQATRVTKDLAMTFKDHNGSKKKAYRDEKCFNCHKLGHFGCDYCQPDKRLAKVGDLSIRKYIDNKSGLWTPHWAN